MDGFNNMTLKLKRIASDFHGNKISLLLYFIFSAEPPQSTSCTQFCFNLERTRIDLRRGLFYLFKVWVADSRSAAVVGNAIFSPILLNSGERTLMVIIHNSNYIVRRRQTCKKISRCD